MSRHTVTHRIQNVISVLGVWSEEFHFKNLAKFIYVYVVIMIVFLLF